MPLERNLEYAREAILYTKKKLPYGSNNQVHNPQWFYHGAEGCSVSSMDWTAQQACESLKKAAPSKYTIRNLLSLRVKYWFDGKIGNCGQQADVAFYYLTEIKKLRKVDELVVKGNDHQFVLIGRKDNSNINDYTTWGKDAVVCDPWAFRYYPAEQIEYQLNDLLVSEHFRPFAPQEQTITPAYSQYSVRDQIDNAIAKHLGKTKLSRRDRRTNVDILKKNGFLLKENPETTAAELDDYKKINSYKKSLPDLSPADKAFVHWQYLQYVSYNEKLKADPLNVLPPAFRTVIRTISSFFQPEPGDDIQQARDLWRVGVVAPRMLD